MLRTPASADKLLPADLHSRSSLARIQQVAVAFASAGALTWLLWFGERSLWLGFVGVLLILLGYVLVLALEFLVAAWLSRSDPLPTATAGATLRAWWHEVLTAPQVFCWRQPFRWQALPDTASVSGVRTGVPAVVFVHGFLCNRGFWLPWMRELQVLGIPYTSVNLEPVFGSITDYIPALDEAVSRAEQLTGVPPILVCHSMGGLAARAWLAQARRAGRNVYQVITIGTPHHGTWLSRFGVGTNSRQMRPNHEWLTALAADEAAANAAPYERFVCWFSNADNIVFPPSTAMLPGADNRHVPGVAHVALAFHPRVMKESLAMLASAASSPADRAVS